MHPDRLSMLAVRHAPSRKVIHCDNGASIIRFDLECGHTSHMAPHFDPRSVTHRNCTPCGVEAVKADPHYSSEFEPAPVAAEAPKAEPETPNVHATYPNAEQAQCEIIGDGFHPVPGIAG